jgi:NADH-quinone oxidoreductase subunit B
MESTSIQQGVTVGAKPEGYEGAGFFATSLDKVVGLARKNSIWPLPFATSCCGIEFMATTISPASVRSVSAFHHARQTC